MVGQCCKSSHKINLTGSKILLNLMKISKSYNEERDEGYFLEVDIQYPENLHELHKNLQLLPEKIKTEKVKKLVILRGWF